MNMWVLSCIVLDSTYFVFVGNFKNKGFYPIYVEFYNE